MNIDVVDNEGQSSMKAELEKELATSTIARLATASLTRAGIRFIEEALNGKRRSLRILMLIGLYNGHTEPAALRRLMKLMGSFGEQLEVRIAENPRFHWKAFIFASKKGVTAYVGSSNLTADGLGAEGEINLRLTAVSGNSVSRHITDTFDRVWVRSSVPLTAAIVGAFAPASRQSRDANRQIDPIIKQLLRPPKRTSQNVDPCREPQIMTCVDEESPSRATRTLVRTKTAWESKNWEWMVCSNRRERDRLVNTGAFYLVEQRGRSEYLSLYDVRDEDDFQTEDGRYFVAYQKRKGSIERTLSPSLLSLLKEMGVIQKEADLRRTRKVSRAHREVLNSLLRVSVK